MTPQPWTGSYVRDALGVQIHSDPAGLLPVEDLVGVALRRNPRRAHLLVSRVLAKHVPTDPALVLASGELLGVLTAEALGCVVDPVVVASAAGDVRIALGSVPDDGGLPAAGAPLRHAAARQARTRLAALAVAQDAAVAGAVTIGYAETATGLGRIVADTLGSYYIHSTRHAPAGAVAYGAFEEAHSHATSHRLLPTDPSLLDSSAPIVLVDDELSTGATIINTISELHQLAAHPSYTVATLIDLRSDADRNRFAELARTLGCTITVVALGTGRIDLGEDILPRAQALIDGLTETGPDTETQATPEPGVVTVVHPAVLPVRSDRFGNLTGNTGGVDDGGIDGGVVPAGSASPAELDAITAAVRAALPASVTLNPADTPVLVLGTEEFIHLPLTVAQSLADTAPGAVRFSTTTRSPIMPIDDPGYAIRSVVDFASHDVTEDGPGPRHAYNTAGFSAIVLLPEPGTDPASLTGPGSITEALRAVAPAVVVVLLPADLPDPHDWTTPVPHTTEEAQSTTEPAVPLTGPEFGSYAPADVTWLLKDLRDAQLEAPTAEREAAIQSGGANYAESLPLEYLPSAEYQGLYEEALERSAPRVAQAVGTVTELALAARNREPVLVSLARAGTPIGILMRRWAQQMHGLDLPHYTMSIVRGVGMDENALRYLAATYDPARILFVDGWTGKGAITRELTAALEKFEATDGVRFSPELAVLADPGHSVQLFGTREDYLIPSACLNSTVSGLVSRTVFNRELIGPTDFHGAKFYAHLAEADVSRDFLAAVGTHFDAVRSDAEAAAEALAGTDRTPTWIGWQAVEALSEEYGIHNVNLVKPGVGETTRVLLRRVPWKVLVHPDARAEVAHVLLLAEQRGVPVEEVPDLPFSCVGLIHPRFSAGAVGADGRAVAVSA
ncbi:phosphoribosyltransferase [Arthrobacter sp. zg-ZUI100]|uniref:phosphoribosyltransferase domain-containing protein n=1 Tax=Arthrobacter jiangjiafuii TaxID=2817475 RepID=UPI001AEDBAED|nr:phosphoribosyltransferase domain-containing protein [Arthrobacter jiangjiafuii]MBP3037427.1 phosphoribosyltransferase [Arthrobacter jiangjiafuii]